MGNMGDQGGWRVLWREGAKWLDLGWISPQQALGEDEVGWDILHIASPRH